MPPVQTQVGCEFVGLARGFVPRGDHRVGRFGDGRLGVDFNPALGQFVGDGVLERLGERWRDGIELFEQRDVDAFAGSLFVGESGEFAGDLHPGEARAANDDRGWLAGLDDVECALADRFRIGNGFEREAVVFDAR